MATNYPTFQSDPTLNSVTASAGISSSLGVFSNNIGIGTNTPEQKLHVVGNVILGDTFNSTNGYPASDLIIHAGTASNALGQSNAISIFREQTGPSWPQIATFALGRYDAALSPAPATRLDINLKNSSDATDVADVTVMTLNSAGNVGIGTTGSLYKLDVSGTGRFSSNVEITGTLKGITQLTASTGISSSLGLFSILTGSAISSSGVTSLLGSFTSLTASNITSSGNMTLGGNIVLSNAGGITFGTTAGGGGTSVSTTLSDYEYGTWTPILSSSTNNNIVSSSQSGYYVKIGKHVTVGARYSIQSTGSTSAGNVNITNFPFSNVTTAPSLEYGNSCGYYSGFSGISTGIPIVVLGSNSTVAQFRYAGNNSTTLMQVTNLTTLTDFSFTVSYLTN